MRSAYLPYYLNVRYAGISNFEDSFVKAIEAETKPLEEKKMNTKTLYYVGAAGVELGDHLCATEAEAIEKARNAVNNSGHSRVVVKIVALVERQAPPTKVTKFRGK